MNLYLISQYKNNHYDTYDSAVVCANSEDEARMMHPSDEDWDGSTGYWSDWVNSVDVDVELLGTSKEDSPYVICASFNAG